ncbi:Eco57I restriction-modification methylase domain-containing protein [Prevotella sp.]|uniref:Eco57I restriction-modification methylase domain-containing protein n=1 Tax=Prevotella sp. TaxID=59823 RepID=UPI0025F9428E|nr:N-6 DNA methylase [Prevotella sp.]
MTTYNKETFKRLFQSKFNLSKWQMLLQDYFHADKVRVNAEVLDEDAEDRKGYFLGSMTTQDNYELGFFYYEMEDGSVLRRKVGLRNLIRPYLGYGFDAALAVFNDGTNWRLSLICDLKEDATSTKRFTYVFGDEKAYYKTPVSRFVDLQKKANEFLEIKKAFSVEALSDDFFAAYRRQYAEFVKFLTGKEYVKKGNKWVEQETGEPDVQYFTSFKEDDKLVRDYIKKMMGRIVFLYFLQSKGWLAGNLHYMHDLFYDASDEVKGDFLDKVLEPMFFGLLNTKPEDRSSAPLVNGVGVKYIPNADEIPYLNGGLFQQEKIDEVESVFPAEMFQSLFDFFDSYNFTIDENDPNDAEVGVDPEMLGKIFENLLEDNKDKGAFYTPKEIVRYMCQESLTAYLQTGIDDAEVKEHIANFVKTNDVEELGGASSELAMSIDQKLIDVKICDPAIGSGAFPMGLLRELYACRKSIEIFEEDNAADIKRHIIQNNIYGVDIEKGAVDIARLRFWLALIIDEKKPMPLPNLDFKIMQGNSLLESYKGVDLDVTSKKLKTGKDTKKTRGVLSLGFEETDVQKIIQDLVKSYFSITDHTLRAQRRQQIDKYVKDYIKVCAEGNHEVQDAVDELEIPNDQFFLWHTYFADVFEKGGFDIVIGNPPYVNVEGISVEDKKIYKDTFTCFEKRADLFSLFLEMALTKLASASAVVTYIIPSIIHSNLSYKKLRNLFLDNKWLSEVCYTGGKVFHAPTVDTTILRFCKRGNKKIILKNAVDFENQQVSSVPSDYFSLFQNLISISDQKTNDLMGKLFNHDFPRLDENFSVFQGIVTGNNPAFIFDSEAEALSNGIDKELLHPLCHGRDIERYAVRSRERRILYLNNSVNIETYPNTETWLAAFKDALSKRREAKNGAIQWYSLQWPRVKSELDLKEKILVQNTRNEALKTRICAVLDDKSVYGSQGVNFIIPNDVHASLRYLLGILDSTLINYLFATKFLNLAIKAEYLKQLRMPIPSAAIQKQLESLVSRVLELKKVNIEADTTSLENQIDFLVYHLYGLTYDEVLIVDPETPISREEYEAYKEE